MFVYELVWCNFTELPCFVYIHIIIIFRLVEVAQTSELLLCRKSARTLPASDPSVKHSVGVPWNISENCVNAVISYLVHPSPWSVSISQSSSPSSRGMLPSDAAKLTDLLQNSLFLSNKRAMGKKKISSWKVHPWLIMIFRYYLQRDRGLDISQELEEAQDRKIHRHRQYPEIKRLNL